MGGTGPAEGVGARRRRWWRGWPGPAGVRLGEKGGGLVFVFLHCICMDPVFAERSAEGRRRLEIFALLPRRFALSVSVVISPFIRRVTASSDAMDEVRALDLYCKKHDLTAALSRRLLLRALRTLPLRRPTCLLMTARVCRRRSSPRSRPLRAPSSAASSPSPSPSSCNSSRPTGSPSSPTGSPTTLNCGDS